LSFIDESNLSEAFFHRRQAGAELTAPTNKTLAQQKNSAKTPSNKGLQRLFNQAFLE
jgi:hypothetical protein